MAETLEPQIVTSDYSPLSILISNALRQWGASHPAAIDGDSVLLFMTFANQVIQDINQHPYRDSFDALSFYTDVREIRDVPDLIMVAGLLHYYAQQQASERAQVFTPAYYRTLNSILWHDLNGNTKIEVVPRDHSTGRSSINGLEEE